MDRWFILVLSCLSLGVVPAPSHADIPQVISYQGKVTDTAGNPVADGNYPMRFRLYDAVTGGALLWDSGVRTVAVAGGVFSVLLGESPQPTLNLPFDDDYWLVVTFSGVDQTPRQRLASAGYAYMASGLVPGTVVIGTVTSGGGAAITGTNTATSGLTCGLWGESGSTDGRGVYGSTYATTGPTYGVWGTSASTEGTGIYGWAYADIGSTSGVLGISSSVAGTGVHGEAWATTGLAYGGLFVTASESGRGVYGTATASTGAAFGVHGESGATAGRGVYGRAYASTGITYGMYGESASTAGRGVYGYAAALAGSSYGVLGQSASSSGVGISGYASASTGFTFGVTGQNASTAGAGVYGLSSSSAGFTTGVYGTSPSTDGTGVTGYASASMGTTCGVWGSCDSPSGRGVYGLAGTTTGEAIGAGGQSAATNGRGVYGHATSSSGECFGGRFECNSSSGRGVFGHAYANSGTTCGVYGLSSSPSGYGVYYAGGLAGSGTKSCVVKTSKGPTLMYCQESPENWFEDFGEGQLVDGRCHIELDALFLETVTISEGNPMEVFLQPYHRSCAGLVVERGGTGFDVYNPLDASASGGFGYRVVAKRRGFEARRLDVCEAARTDSYLYPELREKERGESAIGSQVAKPETRSPKGS